MNVISIFAASSSSTFASASILPTGFLAKDISYLQDKKGWGMKLAD